MSRSLRCHVDAQAELLRTMHGPDRDAAAAARSDLVSLHRGLAVRAARTFGGPGDDAVADAMCGLLEALDRFDPGRGMAFSTYAMWWLRKYVIEGRARRRAVWLPEDARADVARLHEVAEVLGVPDDDPRVAARAGVRNPGPLLAAAQAPASLDAPDVTGRPVVDVLVGDDDVAERVEQSTCRAVVVDLVARLSVLERRVLVARFGLDGAGVRTLVEVAGELRLPVRDVAEAEVSALRSLRAGA